MDDLRQKLFPIFLGEAERNLAALRHFLDHKDLLTASAEELETAFRAAHTLKGTANLVGADSIFKIARRLEALLEKHFEARTKPTRVEHEAMQLAVDWLAPLISALQGNLQEPKLFVAEALQALDLAEAFPGRTSLVELLDSQAQHRPPQLDDPFSGDPDLLADEDVSLQFGADPFAEDPGFGLSIPMRSGPEQSEVMSDSVVDPFAEDYGLDLETVAPAEAEPDAEGSCDLPFDPFADDDFELAVEPSAAIRADEAEESAGGTDDRYFQALAPSDKSVEAAEIETADFDDPFGDDEEFGVDIELGAEYGADVVELVGDDSLVASTETVAARAGEIAESLLLPQQETAPRKEYVCCVFSIGERAYHLPIKQMQEIADLPVILPLPLAPPMVSGLINLRGQVIPVINLSILNHHQQAEVRVQRRLVIAEYQNESLAFLADGVPYLSETFSGEKIDMSKFLSLYRVRGSES